MLILPTTTSQPVLKPLRQVSTPFASRKPLRVANRKSHHIANRKARCIARHIANRTCLPVGLEGEAAKRCGFFGGAKKMASWKLEMA